MKFILQIDERDTTRFLKSPQELAQIVERSTEKILFSHTSGKLPTVKVEFVAEEKP